MNKIHALSKETAEKIASGEVIERPLSVVKELVENSLDAGASVISVEIKKGGSEYIRVSDNGSGIPAEDAELAFERFATSKISNYEDLGRIRTLGFRGVALSGIAAVSRTELISGTEGQRAGRRVEIEGGRILASENTASEVGTTVIVRDLFFNTPGKKSFLRSDNTEAALVIDYVSKMALAAPGVRFRMISNGAILFFTSGKGDVKQTIATVYNPVLARDLLPVDESSEDSSMRLTGFVGMPSAGGKNRKYQIFFVNGRWMKSRTLERALDEAYSDKLFEGRFPGAFLFLDIDPSKIDVNLLPNKTELKFYDDEAAADFVTAAVRRALRTPKAAPDARAVVLPEASSASRECEAPVSSFEPELKEKRDEFFADLRRERAEESKPVSSEYPGSSSDARSVMSDMPETVQEEIAVYGRDPEKGFDMGRLEIIGQVFATYIICRGEDALYIFDQHAAHERIMFERFMKASKDGAKALQPLLVPIVLQLSPAEMAASADLLDLLSELGFTLEEFGPNSYAVKECPVFLEFSEAESFVKDVLEKNTTGKGSGSLGRDKIIMRACKSAVKGNDRLSGEEMRRLLEDLEKTENPYSCPHGRPTFLKITQSEMERMFKRK